MDYVLCIVMGLTGIVMAIMELIQMKKEKQAKRKSKICKGGGIDGLL